MPAFSGRGLPGAAKKPLRHEDPAQNRAERYAVPPSDLLGRLSPKEVVHEDGAVAGGDSIQRISESGASG